MEGGRRGDVHYLLWMMMIDEDNEDYRVVGLILSHVWYREREIRWTHVNLMKWYWWWWW